MANDFAFESLNHAQREAVAAQDGPVMILAGAGTGKTRTVTCRIAHMLERKVPASEILAVTFTNKAASEMKERIGGMVSKKAAAEMTVCTFHSLCVRLLRGGIHKLGYKQNFSITAYSDQVGIMKQLIVRKGGTDEKVKAETVLTEISKAKNKGIDVADLQDDFFAQLAVAYQNELRAQNAVDFDDLLLLAEQVLREHSDVRDHFRKIYTRVTVDEFQDTNSLQMRLLQQLVGSPYHVCVVGDDDQSIYGWRGAEVANILEFERFFPNPKVIRLEENYRSTEAVLHTANSLIKHNLGRREKVLRSTRGGGDNIRIVAMPGDDEEADFIADEILGEKTAHGRQWEDFAILFRTNGQSRKLELALRDRKIPYRMVGAQSFYDRREIRDVLAYVALLVSPDNDVPLLRILNAPNRGIGQATAVLATDDSREKGRSVWQSLCDPFFTSTLGGKARGAIEDFVALISGAKNRIDIAKENPADVLSELLVEIEYLPWIERGCKNDSERQQRGEAIHSIKESLRDHIAKGKKLQSFLDDSALASEREDDDLEKKKGATLITLHASKGLEFPIVYLVGLEEGYLPHFRSITEGTKDEERRLLYVGITRAQELLTLTYCSVRMKWGQKTGCQPSSFIGELDDKYIEHTTFDDIQNVEMSSDDLDDFFSSMNNIFAEED
ncbi:MAG: UvrD-helicase domain-containing protein [Akkermansiaceae bacterium]|nr:UvrD-helicase domain-containing protein [Akkermansiaceae bacterium]MDP4646440.1 UvrD-helicase domain-containing protein [Akkermansiaceae bacterium]MDP4780047.1 UvrD-helicase domain-containing protein [Akkermansiaceae bacterium]MDP4847641.1 UvrD-helicase domain-containing protein [Akkermansiaceae bacterium]MDP4896212.1 UvrD-helicase domain-containing protein [Akkermansiaceae bacterium]